MNKFESYDYLKVTVEETRLSHYIDGYECFGWKLDPNIPLEVNGAKAVVHFKRSRAILNKVELTRLQSHFEQQARESEPEFWDVHLLPELFLLLQQKHQ